MNRYLSVRLILQLSPKNVLSYLNPILTEDNRLAETAGDQVSVTRLLCLKDALNCASELSDWRKSHGTTVDAA